MSGDESKELTSAESPSPKPDVSGTPEGELLAQATAAAVEAGQSIARTFQNLNGHHRRNIVLVFRRQLIPPGKPGRRRNKEITAAYGDWNAGMRGVELYSKHIRGWSKHSQWRRKAEARALMDAIRTRRRREHRRRERA